MYRKPTIFVILLAMFFLIVIALLSSNIPSLLPHRILTVANQVVQSGPYQVTLWVSAHLPHVTDPADLTIRIVKQNTHQLVTNATVLLVNSMETMDMGTGKTKARLQNDGSYLAHLPFTMSGRWQVRVLMTFPGEQTFSALFEVTAQ